MHYIDGRVLFLGRIKVDETSVHRFKTVQIQFRQGRLLSYLITSILPLGDSLMMVLRHVHNISI